MVCHCNGKLVIFKHGEFVITRMIKIKNSKGK